MHSIETPAAWVGKELLTRPDWLLTLSDVEVAELATAASRTAEIALDRIEPGTVSLPTLRPRLMQIQDSLESGSGATLIRGLPGEDCSDATWERLFWILVQHIGTPLSQTAGGERIFHVRDAGLPRDDPRVRGPNTRNRLSFHTDRCDVIAFMCLRQAISGGDNDLISSAAVFNEVRRRRPDLLDELLQPYCYLRHNVDRGNEMPFCHQPIFSFCDGHFAASYLRVLIDRADAAPDLPSLSDRQREALDFLDEVVEDPALQVRIRQRPGDILLLNNWVTFHRRTEFEDHTDPDLKRHLLRIWLSVPNSRPIDPRFGANYGSTAAGAIRGGMRPT